MSLHESLGDMSHIYVELFDDVVVLVGYGM
jgi:hypothetical protein